MKTKREEKLQQEIYRLKQEIRNLQYSVRAGHKREQKLRVKPHIVYHEPLRPTSLPGEKRQGQSITEFCSTLMKHLSDWADQRLRKRLDALARNADAIPGDTRQSLVKRLDESAAMFTRYADRMRSAEYKPPERKRLTEIIEP